MKRSIFLLFIIFLEGYVVLSTELLAIRQTLPFVGSGTDTLSIIIAAVLMPLAFGYYAGGRFRGNVRRKIIKNLLVAQIILIPALSYVVLTPLFEFFILEQDFRNRILLTILYSSVFLVVPVYLLGQTVPLITNYFRNARLSDVAGRILFFSTLGSFFGAVLTTTVLMNVLGVAMTASVTIACMTFLIVVLAFKKSPVIACLSVALLGITMFLNSSYMLAKINVVASNAYSTVQVEETQTKAPIRYLRLNRSISSGILVNEPETPLFDYATYIDRYYLKSMQRENKKGDILILGAGGFTLGRGEMWNNYTYVDIDPDLKNVIETEFLKAPLEENKTFVPEPARAYLKSSNKKYDLIIMDIYRGPAGIPSHLLTLEFFTLMGQSLNKDGILVIHMISSPLFEDEFTKTIDNTIRTAYPYAARQVMGGIKPWGNQSQGDGYHSVLYQIKPQNQSGARHIFTDNMNDAGFIQGKDVPY